MWHLHCANSKMSNKITSHCLNTSTGLYVLLEMFKWISMFAVVLAIKTYSWSFMELDRTTFTCNWVLSPLPVEMPRLHSGIASSVSHACLRAASVGKTRTATHLRRSETRFCPGLLLDLFSHCFFGFFSCFPRRFCAQ